jgi:hypothetical protein
VRQLTIKKTKIPALGGKNGARDQVTAIWNEFYATTPVKPQDDVVRGRDELMGKEMAAGRHGGRRYNVGQG